MRARRTIPSAASPRLSCTRRSQPRHSTSSRVSSCCPHVKLTTEYIPKQGALDGIAAALQTQGAQLAEIQRRLEEEAHESGDKTLVEAPTTAMLKAVLSSQTAMMDKFAELADAHESLYSLRDATDALLAAHADVRSLRTDREHDVLQAQTLADVQRHLQEEGARTRAAETEVAMLRAQRDEAEREHEREKERAERQVAALKAAVEEAGAAKEAARAEAEKGTEELAAEREASQALKAQLVEAQVAATVSPMAEDELAALKAELATAKATVADGARAAADEAAALKTQIASATQRAEAAERSASEVVLRAQLEDATVRAEERERDAAWREQLSRDVAATSASLAAVVQSEGAARAELAGVHTLLAQQGEEHTAVMDQLRAEVSSEVEIGLNRADFQRDAMAMLAEERHAEASRAQAEAAGLNKRVVERFDVFEGILRAEKERAAASEAETAALRRDVSASQFTP
jgi:hypothetical protein